MESSPSSFARNQPLPVLTSGSRTDNESTNCNISSPASLDLDNNNSNSIEMTVPSSSRRRHRSSVINRAQAYNRSGGAKGECDISLLHSTKDKFIQVVHETMDVLMNEHGFSRERAISTLLQEVSSSQVEVTEEAPCFLMTDEQVFEAMQKYGLSADLAVRALTISTALERIVSKSCVSFTDALEVLIDKLGKAKLDPKCPSGECMIDSTLSNELTRVLPTKSSNTTTGKRNLPDVQILTCKPQQQAMTSSPLNGKVPRQSSQTSFKPLTLKNTKEIFSASLDSTGKELSDNSASLTNLRQRANSVAEEVSAKLAVAAVNCSSVSNDLTPLLKRPREEDGGAAGNNNGNTTTNIVKRSRLA